MLLHQTWAIQHRKKEQHRAATNTPKRKFKFRKHKKTGQYHAMDNKRNLSSEVPNGWDKQKWLKRSVCPSCGSRWHRDCKDQPKGFAKKPFARGSSSSSAPSGNRTFFMNMTTAAIATAASASYLPGAQGFEMQSFNNSQLSLTCQTCADSNPCQSQFASTLSGVLCSKTVSVVECSDLKLDEVCHYDKPIETFHECSEHEEKFEDCSESPNVSSDLFSTSYCCFKVPCYFPIFEKRTLWKVTRTRL